MPEARKVSLQVRKRWKRPCAEGNALVPVQTDLNVTVWDISLSPDGDRMTVGGWILVGILALPGALSLLVFLLAEVIAPDSEAGLAWVALPALLIPAAIIGGVIGAVIGLFVGTNR